MIKYELIVSIAAMGYLWSQVLTRDGMLFGWFPQMVKKILFTEVIGRDEHLNFVYKNQLLKPLEKPLYACAVCVTGFWGTLFGAWQWYEGSFAAIDVILTSVLAMTLTKILTRYA